jgi:hypothetical protein
MKEKILRKAKIDQEFRRACIKKLSAKTVTKQFSIRCVIDKMKQTSTGMGSEINKAWELTGGLILPHSNIGFKCLWEPEIGIFSHQFLPVFEGIGSVKMGSFLYELLSQCLGDMVFE